MIECPLPADFFKNMPGPPQGDSDAFTEDELQLLLGFFQMKLKGQMLFNVRTVEGMRLDTGANCGITSFMYAHGVRKFSAIGKELDRRAPSGDFEKPAKEA